MNNDNLKELMLQADTFLSRVMMCIWKGQWKDAKAFIQEAVNIIDKIIEMEN